MKKTPRRRMFDEKVVALSRLERFVLSRVDGELSVNEIVQLTGLAGPQVEQILGKLQTNGVVELSEAASEPQLDEILANEPLADPNDVLYETPGEAAPPSTAWIANELPRTFAPPSTTPQATWESGPDDSDAFAVPLDRVKKSDPAKAAAEAAASAEAAPSEAAAPEYGPASERTIADPKKSDAPAKQEEPPSPPVEEEEEKAALLVPAEGDVTDPDEINAAELQNYRKLYETQLRQLPLDERISMARHDAGPILFALCFDQDPLIVKGILENDRMNLDHARLIAANHRNPIGLEAICGRVSLMQDMRVQRMLLRNAQLTEVLMRRILQHKRLTEIYKATINRDIPDRTRGSARNLFRTKFGLSPADEKFEIIWTTEGRVLTILIGQTIDQKTTSMFCARSITSIMLIQSFARFPATPPGILAHILKQPMVQRQAHLRNLILQHPNVPSEAKRRF